MDYAELEIALSRPGESGPYQVELRFDSPNDQSEKTPVRGLATFDPNDFVELEDGPGNKYGLALAESLFADPAVRTKYGEFKATVAGANELTRVKLFVDRSAPDLHRLRWELLVDPDTQQPLATSERILFSRSARATTGGVSDCGRRPRSGRWSPSRIQATSPARGSRRST